MRPVALALLLALLPGACAEAPPDMVIEVRITGAVTRSGTYAHPHDPQHECTTVRIIPLPDTPPRFLPTIMHVRFNPNGLPPASRFRLQFPVERDAGWPFSADVSLTAGGRVWESGPGSVAEIPPPTDLSEGRFLLRDLRPADGGEERITVEGRWRCANRQ
ncbi:hypothetical protein [Muricoccus radiodurans]|uniref:hypothetical protein n=1 Tax=Muricoccus radiodurans TaxID=2231721 RepID=UPI003CEFC2F4